jgi:hypothetical protein
MNLAPDFTRTVTGWKVTDWLTHPAWLAYCAFQRWLFFRHVGGGSVKRGRRIVRDAAARHPSSYDPIDEAIRELFESYER